MTKSVIEKNIEILEKNSFHRIAPLDQDQLRYHYQGTDDGEAFFTDNSNNILLLKPEIAEEYLPDISKRQLIFIFGIYAVEEIQLLIEKANKNTFFVIIETEQAFFLETLKQKDLMFLDRSNVMIIAQPIENVPSVLEWIFASYLMFLAGNSLFYSTYFYRTYGTSLERKLMDMISSQMLYRYTILGNSTEDSLIGLRNNLENLRFLSCSKDISKLKNSFKGVPAFIVSAGPSLDKNIDNLLEVKGKGLILAVDTIVDKLLKHGIVPDFMFSLERTDEVYKYFYQSKDIPKETTLVAPLLLKPEIFESYQGTYAIGLRKGVGEYLWLNKILQFSEEAFISMGLSCANLAFGFAAHVGASPVVFVGQDLAYATDGGDHASGTIYDEGLFNDGQVENVEVEGYYGGKVLSERFWVIFRKWFENEIIVQNVEAINATEGGAKINNAQPMPLAEVVDKYCSNSVNVKNILNDCPNYTFDWKEIYKNLEIEINELKVISDFCLDAQKRLGNISLKPTMNEKQLLSVLKEMNKNDVLLNKVLENKLLFHNLHGTVIVIVHKLYKIPEVLSYENLMENLRLQEEFCSIIYRVTEMILGILEEYAEENKFCF